MKFRRFAAGALAAVLVQSAALGKILYDRAQLLLHGKEVVLQSSMVDPRDLFRGHYVRLDLSISRIPVDKVTVIGKPEYGKEVFVTLKPGGEDGFWQTEKLYTVRPEATEGPFIRGKFRFRRKQADAGEVYQIDFPIDRFFAEEERAKELEKVRRDQKLGIIAALDGEGDAAIKGISVEGKLIYNEPVL